MKDKCHASLTAQHFGIILTVSLLSLAGLFSFLLYIRVPVLESHKYADLEVHSIAPPFATALEKLTLLKQPMVNINASNINIV